MPVMRKGMDSGPCALLLISQHDMTCLPGLLQINDALVAGASEMEGQVPLCIDIGAVHQHIDFQEQRPDIRVFVFLQCFQCVARVGPYIEPHVMDFFCQLQHGTWLAKGISAAERDAGEQGIFPEFLQKLLGVDFITSVKCVGLRILAVRAMMRTALREYRQAAPVAIYNRIIDKTCDAKPHVPVSPSDVSFFLHSFALWLSFRLFFVPY